jgi:hypothetical protein
MFVTKENKNIRKMVKAASFQPYIRRFLTKGFKTTNNSTVIRTFFEKPQDSRVESKYPMAILKNTI